MEYRLYKPEDFAALYAIEEVCFQPPFRFERRYMQRLVNARNSATWIAEAAGGMAGFAIVEWSGAGNHAYIPTIEVLPDRRREGVGGELLRRLEESARAAGAWALWLHVDESNAHAIRLYEAHGFVAAAKEEHFYAPGRGAFLYRKLLQG
ncbi:MAG TPA: N-acetyltransferase [Terracidiphilus sp.]|nr:N-acetyltransferase [Terracidiphilus sp.]